jgi:hypothetical protein
MKCLACGAVMRLMDVRTDTTTPFAIKRRVFQCSSCRQTAQRLEFDRSGLPDIPLPVMTHTNAPAIARPLDRCATSSASKHQGEKLISRQVAVPPPKPVDWGLVVGKLSSALREQAAATRGSAWAKAVEKLRSKQIALTEREADRSEISTRALVSSARDQLLLRRDDGKRPSLAVVPKGTHRHQEGISTRRNEKDNIARTINAPLL